jgi:hypothetical protein
MNSCFGPLPPSNQNPTQNSGFIGLGGCVQRHPETGLPIPINSQCFTLPRVNNITDDKKKYIDSLYLELTTIRQQIDKLSRSVDTMYELIRHI